MGGGEVDQRTDIWAVGILFWRILTGRHPLAPLTRTRLETVTRLDLPMPSISDMRRDVGLLGTLVDQCLIKHKARRMPSAQALLDALEPLLPGRASTVSDGEPANPYIGLAAFQQTDAERFFGRDRETAKMMTMLRNHRMVTVAGTSGAGKSSFVRAGVIPALERSGQAWESFIIRPGRQPLAALAGVLALTSRIIDDIPDGEPAAMSHDELIGSLRSQPGYLGAALRRRCSKRHGRILLFVDQFEELYTLGTERDTREAFVRCLEGVADDASSPLRVVLSVRSDFLDRMVEDRAFTDEIIRGMILLAPLARDQLHQALAEPLIAAGYAFESEDMVAAMLDTLQTTRSPLPLLQFTAARLWEARDRECRRIKRASYDALGGIEGALATHADTMLAGLSRDEQRLTRAVFTSLVSEERTRAIVSLDELCGDASAPGRDAAERVVRRLAEARLVLIETDTERGATVELTHESLIDRWPRLVQWLDEDQEARHFRSRLRIAARQWYKQGSSDDLLWRGQTADEAERWLSREVGALAELGERDRGYLQAVVGLAVQTRRRRRQLTVAGFVFVCAVAVAVSLLAVRADRKAVEATRQAGRADHQAAEALKSAAQARNASRMASASQHLSDPTLVLSLVRELEPGVQLPPRWRELARWATHQDIARVVLSHPDVVHSAAFSRDGTRIVTASRDKIARVWNADGTGQPILLQGHRDEVYSAAFSRDGTRIITTSRDRTARVWNADGTGEPILLQGHQDVVCSAEFNRDDTRIVTASWDKTARVWNANGIGEPIVLSGHLDRVSSATFSRDGTRIVTSSFDKTARVWNADGTGEPVVLHGHQDVLYSAKLSNDDTRIVTASFDKTARIWNADGTGRPVVLHGHEEILYSAAFSGDDTRIVTASRDKTVRVWNADGTGKPIVLRGHQALVYSAAFSHDSTRIVTASFDKTARVWNASGAGKPILLHGHQALVSSASFSRDGTRIVTASFDKTARVWNADGTGNAIVLQGHQAIVSSAAFSPDGTRVITASFDKTARVWNADGAGKPIVLQGHENRVASAAFSPDGTRVVTASFDKTARVWNADGTGRPVVLRGHQDLVSSAAFSPDSTRIVTASFDKTARVWNADGTGKPILLQGHRDRVLSAAFSRDGTSIVTASFDKTARIWRLSQQNPDGTTPFIELLGHGSTLVASGARSGDGAFSPDDSRVLTISNDKALRMWNADGTGEPAILRIPELDAYSAAFNHDGTQIVTASHQKRNPATGKMEFWATVWPHFERFTGLDDPALWTATSYCPPIERRVELLGVSQSMAKEQLQDCQTRVAAARQTVQP